jgi:cyanate permease
LAALQDKSAYGSVRAWGALTYGFGNMFVGCMIEAVGDYSPMFFFTLVIVFVALPFAFYSLPGSASETKPKEPITYTVVRTTLMQSRSVRVFFLNSITLGAAMSLVESLLFVAMERTMKGSTHIIAGSSVLISVLFEIPIFQIAPTLIKRYGTKTMLVVANIAWMIRAIGYAFFEHAWIVLVLELLHGVSFGLFYSAAVYICVQQSPQGMESTMQSLLDMTYGGFGVAVGTVCGGYLFDLVGPTVTFLVFSALISVVTILCYRYFDDSIKQQDDGVNFEIRSNTQTIMTESFEVE